MEQYGPGVRFRDNVLYDGARLPYDGSGVVADDRSLYRDGPVPPADKAALTGDARLTAPGTATSPDDLSGHLPTADSPVLGRGLDIAHDGGRDAIGTALPAGMPDLGGLQRTAAAAATRPPRRPVDVARRAHRRFGSGHLGQPRHRRLLSGNHHRDLPESAHGVGGRPGHALRPGPGHHQARRPDLEQHGVDDSVDRRHDRLGNLSVNEISTR
ncbi:hypothetical protein [Streptomyces griseofuscus]|uniref:hypothetical protein n=1 Tax=Streptomyces griseofuscus TaxID=146922 RepID=UPI003456DB8B